MSKEPTYDQKVNKVIEICSNDNRAATLYLQQIAQVARGIDDLHDRFGELHREEHTRVVELVVKILLVELPQNIFFRQHIATLANQHAIVLGAWYDSNQWNDSKNQGKRAYAKVIRDNLTELCLMVANLTGGYDYMRKSSLLVRELLFKDEFNEIYPTKE